MSDVRIALIGIGSVRCGAPILASLATLFGERPIELRLYDADPERLDVFDRFIRVLCLITKATHHIVSTDSYEEAIEDVDFIVLSVSHNCARRFLASRNEPEGDDPIRAAIDSMNLEEHSHASILSLQLEPIGLSSYYRLDWPEVPSTQARATIPLQILRWLNEEEYPFELLKECEKSPLKAWLENPTSAQYVQRA